MVEEKGIDSVSSSTLVKMNGEETGVGCQSKDKEHASKEVVNGENAVVEMKNGEIVMEEEKIEVTAGVEEEKNGGDKIEEDKNNEANAIEDDAKEWNATSEEDDYEEEEEGNWEHEEEEEEEQHEEEEEHEEEKGDEKEENAIKIEQEKVENKFEREQEKVEANSTENIQGSKKRSRKKKIEEDEEEEEENTNVIKNNKLGANSADKVKRPRKRGRKNKMAGLGSETLATKAEDKPGPSGKKASKRVEGMGMIFMCSSKTKKDCYRYNVLGLPASKRDMVEKIYKGMRLFLFDFDLKLMYGIYKAAGPGGFNIEPKAFNSAFPSQVRFTVLDDCLPLAEEKFKTVIKENYYGKNKFNCQLTSQQVKDLCMLFSVSTRGSKSKKLSRKARTDTHIARAEPRIARAEPRIAKGRAEPRVAKGRADPRVAGGRAERRTRVGGGRIRRRSWDEERRSSALVADRRHRDARPTAYDRETYRRRDPDEDRHSPLVGAHRHHDHPIMYERELAPLHRLPPLPPPTAGALPYASYGRTIEVDAYGRDIVVEHREPRHLDVDVRHRDEVGGRDSYMFYREIPSYRDTLYSPAVLAPPQYYPPVEPRAEYRLAAPPQSEYRHLGAAPSEYDRLRSSYRY